MVSCRGSLSVSRVHSLVHVFLDLTTLQGEHHKNLGHPIKVSTGEKKKALINDIDPYAIGASQWSID